MRTAQNGTFKALVGALGRRPRVSVGIFPTPLQPMRRLSEHFRRPVYFKRDDLAGLAVGGSKIRILQFTAGDALARGADMFVAGGYVQSNHPVQVAAVGAALGLSTEVILDVTKGYEPQGNLLLLDLAGAQVRFTRIGSYEGVLAQCVRLASRLARGGRRPHLMTQTRESRVLSAIAYADGFVELDRQLDARGIRDVEIVVGSGGPTYGGLLLGALAGGRGWRVHGVPPCGRGTGARAQVREFINEASAALGLEVTVRHDDVSFLGQGRGIYGEVNRETVAAVRFVAALEGVYLDPVYGGNAMAVLLRGPRGRATDRPLIFVHTGGVPTVFAYERELASQRILDYAAIAVRVDRTAHAARRARGERFSRRRPGGHRSLREAGR